VADEVLVARAHADAALAAAPLRAVGRDRRALDVAGIRDRHRDVFIGDQILDAELALFVDQLRAARIRELRLYRAQLVEYMKYQVNGNMELLAKVTPKFGPGDMPVLKDGTYQPDLNATNCDLNKDGKIDFSGDNPEARCSAACTADAECTEYSNFASRSVAS
jgi:hypothetical protein